MTVTVPVKWGSDLRWYATDEPITPPPMITTSATHHSAAMRDLEKWGLTGVGRPMRSRSVLPW